MVIVWSKPALLSLSKVADYTYENFGERQVGVISEKINKKIRGLVAFPRSAARLPYNIEGRELRVAVVVSTLKILYEINGEELRIHFIWNSNMDVSTVLDIIKLSL